MDTVFKNFFAMYCTSSLRYNKNFSGGTKDHTKCVKVCFGREKRHIFIEIRDLTYTVTCSHDHLGYKSFGETLRR